MKHFSFHALIIAIFILFIGCHSRPDEGKANDIGDLEGNILLSISSDHIKSSGSSNSDKFRIYNKLKNDDVKYFFTLDNKLNKSNDPIETTRYSIVISIQGEVKSDSVNHKIKCLYYIIIRTEDSPKTGIVAIGGRGIYLVTTNGNKLISIKELPEESVIN
jgi:hypothetical protein